MTTAAALGFADAAGALAPLPVGAGRGLRSDCCSAGKAARVFATTMGASQDLLNEGLRRLLVNACYWAVGLGDRIPAQADVAIVGAYKPLAFGFDRFKRGVRPADLVGD